MKLAGRVIGREIKDYGKGKDAEAKEVHFATVRIDGRTGLPPGKFTFALTEEEVENQEFGLGTVATGSFDQPQGRLDLNGRAKDKREKDQAAARA